MIIKIHHKSEETAKGAVLKGAKTITREVKGFCLPGKDEFRHVVDSAGEHWAAKLTAPGVYETVGVIRQGRWL